MIPGYATAEGTARFRDRLAATIAGEHFRQVQELWVGSIGLGTYLGDTDERTDRGYEQSALSALQRGCNLIDTAINYRFQRSERSIGAALKTAIEDGTIRRDEIVLSTKGGFLSFDAGYPSNPAKYFHDEYINRGLCSKEDIVANCHCMTPAYLENQMERSLQNLGVDCIDIYLVHNPETQLSEVTRQDFMRRILAAFKMLESKVAEGKIRMYGTATWDGYRTNPRSAGYLSLEELIGLARVAGGDRHHFRAIQLPYSLAMPEAFVFKNQKFGSRSVSTIEAASLQNMVVLCSASLLQGQLASQIPPAIHAVLQGLRTDAQRAIQFVRSTPGVTTALVGMSRTEHVAENLQTAATPPLSWDKLKELFEE
ncbi:MAG TPA: aldo/keto reductase [Acidobacteriota bacterium]|nr:aldo/keto reductase [Acidobacteriota bacterium]